MKFGIISSFLTVAYLCTGPNVIASQGCPKDWKKYGNSCYLFVMRQMSWGDSRANCLAFGADMVSILDSAENDFIYQQTKNVSATSKFWIGLIRKKTTIDPKKGWVWSDGSDFTNSQWRQGEPNNYGKVHENCAELFKDGNRARWNDNDCANSFSSICKKNKVNASQECSKDWKEFSASCYFIPYIQAREMSWEDSRTNCLGYGADLVSILDSNEVDFVHKEINKLGKYSKYNFWIGLLRNKTKKNAWIWSDGNKLTNPQWIKNEPSNTGMIENCASLSAYGNWKEWNDVNCAYLYSSVCKKEKGTQECPNGWKKYNNACYFFVIPKKVIRKMSWEDSRAVCLGHGADMVSILDSSEVEFVHGQTNTDALKNYKFWIGLIRKEKTCDDKDGWIWSDGNKFTNPRQWKENEPNSCQEKCTEFIGSIRKWNGNNCTKTFASICKRTKVIPDTTMSPTAGTLPSTKGVAKKTIPPVETFSPTTVVETQGCPKNWKKHDISCYLFVTQQMNWKDSRSNCLRYGADMVSILDSSEVEYIYQQVSTEKGSRFWIGLIRKKTTIDPKEGWVWSDGNNFTETHWEENEPNNANLNENCAELTGGGNWKKWNDVNCDNSFFSICKRKKDITTQGCSNDWKEYKISSYYFVTQLMTWGESRANCLGCGGDMVSILDSSEVEFIKQQTNTDALRNYSFWIGLFREKKTSDPKEGWIWSDGNNFTKLRQWRKGEPNNFDKNENCAELEESSKMWNDIDCSNLRASICKTKKENKLSAREKSASRTGAVVGGILGCFVALVLAVVVFLLIRKRIRNRQRKKINLQEYESVHERQTEGKRALSATPIELQPIKNGE